MKYLFAAVASAAMVGSVFAAEALQIKKYADYNGGKRYAAFVKDIDNGVRITNKGKFVQIESVKQIPIDLKKKYQISCEYRLAPGSKTTGFFYFAPVCYDKNGKQITAVSQNPLRGTETVLAAPVKKGDKVVKIKNGAKWIKRYGYIAFGAKADFSDLPNFNVIGIKEIKKSGAEWEIALQTPATQAYPAGTAVREQCAAASYRYMMYTQQKTEWTKFSRILTGAKFKGAPQYPYSWRSGTAKAGIIVFTNGTVDMELRNVSITEVK